MKRTVEYACEGPDCTNTVIGESRLGWVVVTHVGRHGVEVYDFCSWACTIRFAGTLGNGWEPIKKPRSKRVKDPQLRDAYQPPLPGVFS